MAVVYENDILLRNPSGTVSPKLVLGNTDTDTYVYESADDVLDLYVGGSLASRWGTTGLSLDYIIPPSADKAFTMATKQLKFTWTAPITADGALELEVTGGFSGDVLHVHQHTGNPGAGTHLVHLEAADADVVPLMINSANEIAIDLNKAIRFTDTTAPGTPAAGYGYLYCNSDKLYFKSDAGTAYDLTVGVTPVDSTLLDWSTDRYQPYATNAAGAFSTQASNPTNTTRLNYDGYLYVTELYATWDITGQRIFGGDNSGLTGVSGNSTSGIGVYGTVTSGIGVYGIATTGVAGRFNIDSGGSSDMVEFRVASVLKSRIDKDGYLGSPSGSLSHFKVYAGDASGAAGTDAGNLTLKAGNAINADSGSTAGNLYLVPGNGYSDAAPGNITLGDSSWNGSNVNIYTAGTQAIINVAISGKGSGNVSLGTDSGGIIYLRGSSVWAVVPSLKLGIDEDSTIYSYEGTSGHPAGYTLTLKGGSAYSVGDNAGGNVYIYGGAGNGAGARGSVYFGSGAACYLATDDTETYVVAIDSTTGLLSKRAVSTIGGTTPTDDILDWSTDKYTPWSDANKAAGRFYSYTSTAPTNATALAYDGHLYATKFWGIHEGTHYGDHTCSATSSIYIFTPNISSGSNGSIYIYGGNYTAGNGNGASLYIYPGTGFGTGVQGDIYFGTGSAGRLSSGTTSNIIYYDSGTGKITYGAAPSGSSQWTTDTNGITYSGGMVGIGIASTSTVSLHLAYNGSVQMFMTNSAATGDNGNAFITAVKPSVGYHNLYYTAYTHSFRAGSSPSTVHMYINPSGNISIGGTDIEAWDSGYKVIEFVHSNQQALLAGSGGFYLLNNAYNDGSWKYKNTTAPCLLSINNGIIGYRYAAAGTADTAITWTYGFVSDTSGNFAFNGTASSNFKLHSTGTANAWAGGFQANSTTGQSFGLIVYGGTNSSDVAFQVRNQASSASYLYVRGDGNIGAGTASPSYIFHAYKDANSAVNIVAENPNAGNSNWAGFIGKSYGVDSYFGAETTTGSTIRSGKAFVYTSHAGGITINAVHASGTINFVTGADSSSNIRVTIAAGGTLCLNGAQEFTYKNGSTAHTLYVSTATGATHGESLFISAGAAYATGSYNGGNIVLLMGHEGSTGTRGRLMFGTGSGGTDPFNSGTSGNILYYNTSTGDVTYGGTQWTTSGSDLYYSSGKIGIGGAPEAILHSKQTANAQGFFHASTANSSYAAATVYSAYYGTALGTNTTSASYYAFLVNTGVTLTTGGFTGGTTKFIIWSDGATVRGTIGDNALSNQRYFHSETAISCTSGDKCIYLYNNGTSIKLDAYNYGTSAAIDVQLGGNGGKLLIGNSDTNLYRDSANNLKTDDNLTVVGYLVCATTFKFGEYGHTFSSQSNATYNEYNRVLLSKDNGGINGSMFLSFDGGYYGGLNNGFVSRCVLASTGTFTTNYGHYSYTDYFRGGMVVTSIMTDTTWYNSTTKLEFYINNQSIGNQLGMTLDKNGYLNIGAVSGSYRLYVSGAIYATSNITGNSDIRYKYDITDFRDVWKKGFDKLDVIQFKYKGEDEVNIGYSAQNLLKYFPDCVSHDGILDRYGVKALPVSALNTIAILEYAKKNDSEVDKLKRRVKSLEKRVKELEEA